MPDESALRKIRQLIDELESDDAFERLRAIESLALLTQQRLDFAWRDSPEERSRSIRRWRKWLDREVRRRKQETTIQILSSGAAGPEVLQKLLETLGPTQKKALLAQMMLAQAAAKGQAVAGHAACGRCEKRPATVQVTRRVDDGTAAGAWVHEAICEVCAGDRAA